MTLADDPNLQEQVDSWTEAIHDCVTNEVRGRDVCVGAPDGVYNVCPAYMSKTGTCANVREKIVDLNNSTDPKDNKLKSKVNQVFDAIRVELCRTYKDRPYCKCMLPTMNIVEDSLYNEVFAALSDNRGGAPSDQCWYLPCRNPAENVQMLPVRMTNMSPKTYDMPVDVSPCQGPQCINITDLSGADIGGNTNIHQASGCNGESPETDIPPPTSDTTPPSSGQQQQQPQQSQQQQQHNMTAKTTVLWVLPSVIGLVFLVAAFWLVSRRNAPPAA